MCPICQNKETKIVRFGFFRRKTWPAKRVQRYLCLSCGKTFSDQTSELTYRERKARIDQPLFRLLASGVSQSKCAYLLAVHPTTVAKKLIRLGTRASGNNAAEAAAHPKVSTIVFDEMETFEHTKCKPISIAVAVVEGERRILFARAAKMPAKGLLADLSRKRYGFRPDHRPMALRAMMSAIVPLVTENPTFKSDQNPHYPKYLAEAFKSYTHQAFKGRRGCVVGQGELKEGGHDPLFSLNHSCAMFRDNLKRLTRKTWCTTKKIERLQHLVDLYVSFHNQRLVRPKVPARIE